MRLWWRFQYIPGKPDSLDDDTHVPYIHANTENARWVQTEMGNAGAKAFGLEAAPDSLETSISGLIKQVIGTQPFCSVAEPLSIKTRG